MTPKELLMKIRDKNLSNSEKKVVYNRLLDYCTPEADFFSGAPFSFDEKEEAGYWMGINEVSGVFGEVEHHSCGSNEGYWAGIEE